MSSPGMNLTIYETDMKIWKARVNGSSPDKVIPSTQEGLYILLKCRSPLVNV